MAVERPISARGSAESEDEREKEEGFTFGRGRHVATLPSSRRLTSPKRRVSVHGESGGERKNHARDAAEGVLYAHVESAVAFGDHPRKHCRNARKHERGSQRH